MEHMFWVLFLYVVACVVLINQTDDRLVTVAGLFCVTAAFGFFGFLYARSEGLL